jgi:hypothetical protein
MSPSVQTNHTAQPQATPANAANTKCIRIQNSGRPWPANARRQFRPTQRMPTSTMHVRMAQEMALAGPAEAHNTHPSNAIPADALIAPMMERSLNTRRRPVCTARASATSSNA